MADLTVKVPRVRAALDAIAQALNQILEHQSPEDQQKLQGILATLDGLLRQLDGAAPAVTEGAAGPDDPERHVANWREHLRGQRELAGLTRQQLAGRTDLSESTIKLAETSHISAETLRKLLQVPELRLDRLHPFVRLTLGGGDPRRSAFTGWADGALDPLRSAAALQALLAGPGGVLPPTSLCLDPLSAAAYLLTRERDPRAPWKEVAAHVRSDVIDLIAIGPTDGRDEAALGRQLLEGGLLDLRLYLLDASQPLLSVARQRAAEELSEAVFTLHGDLLQLPLYDLLPDPASRRRRMVCLLGDGLGQVTDEARFLQELKQGLRPGDFCLLQVALGPSQEDPWLRGPLPEALSSWLTGVVTRYGSQVQDVSLSANLTTSRTLCPIEGSYAVQVRAQVSDGEHPARLFTLLRSKRYDRTRLLNWLRSDGWSPQEGWHSPGGRRLTVLLQRP